MAFTTASSLFVNCEQKFRIVFASRSVHAASRPAWRLFKFFWLFFTNIPGPVRSLRVHLVCFWRGWRPISLESNRSKCYLSMIWLYYVLTSVWFFGTFNRWTWILFVHGFNTKDELMNTIVVKKCAWICQNWLQSICLLKITIWQPQPASIQPC